MEMELEIEIEKKIAIAIKNENEMEKTKKLKANDVFLKKDQWLSIPKDIWIEIFLQVKLPKEVLKCKMICKTFQKLLSLKLFLKKWNPILLSNDIPPFETNAELFNRTYYRMNMLNEKIPKKIKLDFDDASNATMKLITHEWEPFYILSKSIRDFNIYAEITFQLFKEKQPIRKFTFTSKMLIPLCSDIPGYLLFVISVKMETEEKMRIMAIPTRENLKVLYYDILCMGFGPEVKYKRGIFSISILDLRRSNDGRDFYQVHFKDFCPEEEEKTFTTLHTKIPHYPSPDVCQTSERSILSRDFFFNCFYFSFDENLNMKDNILLQEYTTHALLVSDKEEDFILSKKRITRCRTKETKDLKGIDSSDSTFNCNSTGFINDDGNIIAFDGRDCYCIDTKNWNLEQNKSEIKVIWSVPVVWHGLTYIQMSSLRFYVFNETKENTGFLTIVDKNSVLSPLDLKKGVKCLLDYTDISSFQRFHYLMLRFERNEITKNRTAYYLDYINVD